MLIDVLIDELIDELIDCCHVAVQLLFSIPGITIAQRWRRNRIFLQKTIVPAIRPGRKTQFVEFRASSPKYNLLFYNFAAHLPGDINSPALKQIAALTIPANQT